MNDKDQQTGWFTNLVNGFFGLISLGVPKVDKYIQILIKLIVLFLVLTLLIFAAGGALAEWWYALHFDSAAGAIGSAFSEAVEQSTQPVAVPESTDIPVPSD